MKKMNKIFLPLAFGCVLLPALTGCGSSANNYDVVIRVYNCEDYIDEDLLTAFEEEYYEIHNKTIHVVYDCYDTNESMLSALKTGKSDYDLVCASDYTIQKMLESDMLEPIGDRSLIENYDAHTPSKLHNIFKGIKTTDGRQVYDYSCGYMWGTLGILYNTNFETFRNRGYEQEEVSEDMSDWNVLWNKKYKGTISIKDSMRDTYSVGVMKAYDQELIELKERNEFEETDENYLDDETYNKELSKIFNYCDPTTISKVQKELINLKSNIFGFEVDSGKEDINTGKIGINIAWSGDAVYSMDKAYYYNEKRRMMGELTESNEICLEYQIPETGGNIWFDGWTMLKGSHLHKEEALEFIDFLSRPENAALNMDEIGYTPFIGGDDILDLVRLWYDDRSYILYQYDDSSDDPEEWDFVYDEDGNLVLTDEAEENGWSYDSPEVIDMVVEEGAEPTSLQYMFEGTQGEREYEDWEYIIYSSETHTQFETQYPSEETMKRLAVMEDYKDNNRYVLDMWEIVKSDSLPIGMLILLIVEVALGLGVVLYFVISKKVNKKMRVNRRKHE